MSRSRRRGDPLRPSPVAVAAPARRRPGRSIPFALAGPPASSSSRPTGSWWASGRPHPPPPPRPRRRRDLGRLTAALAAIPCDDRVDAGDQRGAWPSGPCPSTGRPRRRWSCPRSSTASSRRGRNGSRSWPRPRPTSTGQPSPARRLAGLRRGSSPPRVAATGPGRRPPARRLGVQTALLRRLVRAMVAEAVSAIGPRRGGQGGPGPPGRRDHGRRPSTWRPCSVGGTASSPTAPSSPCPPPDGQFVGASPELLVERSGLPGPQPAAGRNHRPGRRVRGGRPPRASCWRPPRTAPSTGWWSRPSGGARPPLLRAGRPDRARPGPPAQHHPPGHLGDAAPWPAGRTARCPRPSSWWPRSIPPRRSGRPRRPRPWPLIARLEPEVAGPLRRTGGLSSTPEATAGGCSGIRAVTVPGPDARLAAGVGIVEGSDPRTELVETVSSSPRCSTPWPRASPSRPAGHPPAHQAGGLTREVDAAGRAGAPVQADAARRTTSARASGSSRATKCPARGRMVSSAPGMRPGQGHRGPGGTTRSQSADDHGHREVEAAEGGRHRGQFVGEGPLLDHEGPPVPTEGAPATPATPRSGRAAPPGRR